MNKFCRNTITNWRKLKLPFEAETFVVAVSGGADSVSLILVLHELRQLKKLKLEFVVAHLNHNLRGKESDQDAEFVTSLCQKLGFKFSIEKVDLPKTGNLEENARIARYEFLMNVAKESGAFGILTAHTKNDQAETLLMNLIRGSGVDGFSAMPETREISPMLEIKLIRPFLSWAKRFDTEEYCKVNEIEFREDSMNSDEKFLRIKVRKELIPILEKINPKIIDTLSQTSRHFKLQPTVLDKTNVDFSDGISTKTLLTYCENERYLIIRKWLRHNRGHLRNIGLKHVESIDRLMNSRKSGREVELPGFVSVVKKDGMLLFRKQRLKKP